MLSSKMAFEKLKLRHDRLQHKNRILHLQLSSKCNELSKCNFECSRLKDRVIRSSSSFGRELDLSKALKHKKLIIVVAGMRHSGSTALFNILRLAFRQRNIDCISGYSEKLNIPSVYSKNFQVCLVKTHELRDDVLDHADLVITSIRDLRNSVASAVRRKFKMLEKLGGSIEYAKYNRSLHDLWYEYSNYQFNYEDFVVDPHLEIELLLKVIGLARCDVNYLTRSVLSLPVDNYETTLLSPSHITDPDRRLSYEDTLTREEIDQIESQNGRWLRSHGYGV